MIKARTNTGLCILGLDAENMKRLMEGKPMLLSLAEIGGRDDIAIVYGETLSDIQAGLESVFGEMPEPSKRMLARILQKSTTSSHGTNHDA